MNLWLFLPYSPPPPTAAQKKNIFLVVHPLGISVKFRKKVLLKLFIETCLVKIFIILHKYYFVIKYSGYDESNLNNV